jgi:hypothetical protein
LEDASHEVGADNNGEWAPGVREHIHSNKPPSSIGELQVKPRTRGISLVSLTVFCHAMTSDFLGQE